MGKQVTLQTIADRLGVSRTTVSNAYNRPDQLAPELRDRIFAAAIDLGYSGPDPAARRLRSGRRDAVGLLFGEQLSYAFTDPAAVMLLQGISRATESVGVSMLLVPARGGQAGSAVQDAVVSAFAVYCMPARHPSLVAALERRVPVVVIDEPRLDGHAYVGVEDRDGARLAAEHLVGLGHRRFAVVAERTLVGSPRGPLMASGTVRTRLAGYEEALTAAGLDWRAVPVAEAPENRVERGAEATRDLLERHPETTAVLAVSDQLALGALAAARAIGRGVPDELSVVGFDDVPAASWSRPGLTTVRQPLLEKGEVAGRMLVDPDAPREVVLPIELVVRGSTAAAPG